VGGEAPVAANGSSAAAPAPAAAAGSSKSSKNARKKANRKANKRAATAATTALLSYCSALRDATVMGEWFAGFRSFRRGGGNGASASSSSSVTPSSSYRFYYFASDELSDGALEWAFRLTRLNMQRHYDRTEGWGWNDKGEQSDRATQLSPRRGWVEAAG
jgi:cellulase/cellobiase CelA1